MIMGNVNIALPDTAPSDIDGVIGIPAASTPQESRSSLNGENGVSPGVPEGASAHVGTTLTLLPEYGGAGRAKGSRPLTSAMTRRLATIPTRVLTDKCTYGRSGTIHRRLVPGWLEPNKRSISWANIASGCKRE